MTNRSMLAAVMIAASIGLAQAQTVPAPLTGRQAWAALVGNTAAGKLGGMDFVHYYLADGTVKTTVGNKRETGVWALEGEQICFNEPGGARTQRSCFSMEVVGKVVTLKGKSGIEIRLDILEGNAKNL